MSQDKKAAKTDDDDKVVQSSAAQTDAVPCDWAYWVKPDSGGIKPAKVSIRSSRSSAAVTEQRPRSQSKDERPWRAGMKKTVSAPVVADEAKIVEKPLPEKPWRKNMRTDPKPAPEPEPDKPKHEERAWRHNMKKEKPAPEAPPVVAKKRHYDRKEVREFIRTKKLKEREEKAEKEKQEQLQKEMIKRRLTELDKLQKQITEADLKEFKRLGQAEKNLSEEGQTQLREKLLELTEQMKSRWRERQKHDNHDTHDNQNNASNTVPQLFVSSMKTNSVEKTELPPPSQPALLTADDQETGVMSLSEVSDATEIKSLSENPRNMSNKTNDSSKTWNERLNDVEDDNDDTKYRTVEKLRQSVNPTPLTDQVPERDTESKSEKLRLIVSEVFERHKSDLEYIKNMTDIDVPDTVAGEFVPRYPDILHTTPGSDHQDTAARAAATTVLSSSDSERPPQWIEVTKDNTDTDNDDGRVVRNQTNNLSATVYKKLPENQRSSLRSVNASFPGSSEPPIAASSPELGVQHNFINTVLKKYELPQQQSQVNNTSIPSNFAISEGL